LKRIIFFSLIFTFLFILNAFCSIIIELVEYYIDDDPGFGKGIHVPFDKTSSNNLSLDFNVNLESVDNGFHVLFIRSMDASGNWSLSYSRPFYKIKTTSLDAPSKIIKAEYYFDDDPGFNNGIKMPIEQGKSISKNYVIDLSNIGNGFHVLYCRVKDEFGRWSIAYSRPFFKTEKLGAKELPDIVQIEYYFDNDCEVGQGINVPLTGGINTELSFFANINDLKSPHILYVRVKDENGTWSDLNAVKFSSTPMSLLDVIIVLHSLAKIPLPEDLKFAYKNLNEIIPDNKLDMKDAIKIIRNLSGS